MNGSDAMTDGAAMFAAPSSPRHTPDTGLPEDPADLDRWVPLIGNHQGHEIAPHVQNLSRGWKQGIP